MIRKGEPWGEPVVLDGSEPRAHTDAELARLLVDGARLVVVDGGDLHHSLGGRPPPEPISLPIDLVEVRLDDSTFHAVAHVVARRRWWRGEFAVGMNGTHLKGWNLGPKAHPNDGLLDVTRGRLDLGDRLAARRRAVTATHLPHPGLRTERVESTEWIFDAPTTVYVDGVAIGRSRRVGLRVLPDRGWVTLA